MPLGSSGSPEVRPLQLLQSRLRAGLHPLVSLIQQVWAGPEHLHESDKLSHDADAACLGTTF